MPNVYSGTIAKSLKLTDKSIFFVLKPEDEKTLAVIGFFNNFDKEYIAELRNFKLNQEISFLGREHTNKKSGAKEIVIEGPVVKELTVEEALAMPDPNLAPVEERVLPERKYKFKHPKYKEEVVFWTDGFYIWTEGKKDKKEKLTYEFIQGYNKHVTSDKWLSPDWYTIEVAKRHQAHLDANPRLAAIVDELSVY